MKLIDYTGKLNTHQEYLQVLELLEDECKYIEYVLVNDFDCELVDKFADSILSVEQKNKWWGTKSSQKTTIYKMHSSKAMFAALRKFETFCKYIASSEGDMVIDTDFGQNDIAFLDDKELPLLFTTTHEGYITIRDDLFK